MSTKPNQETISAAQADNRPRPAPTVRWVSHRSHPRLVSLSWTGIRPRASQR